MLQNIALIASLISAVTAVTTSLRAVGASREFSKHELQSKIKTSCRVGDTHEVPPLPQRSSLRLHLYVTLIWYVLAVLFSAPLIMEESMIEFDAGLLMWISLFLLLALLLSLIWWKVLSQKG